MGGDLYKEATVILGDAGIKLTTMKPREFIDKYPPLSKKLKVANYRF